MIDLTPPPYGDVTRRWTQLSDHDRGTEAGRLLGRALLDDPIELTAEDYRRVVLAARAGDAIAFAWLATLHRPLLIHRGRALFEDDPAEWGSVSLEVLHRALKNARLDCGRWLRRHVVQRIGGEVSRLTFLHIERRRVERATDPTDLVPRVTDPRPAPGHDPHPELSETLTALLKRLEPAVADALFAVADGWPIEGVARDHHLAPATLRQQLKRARRRLQPELAAYHRTAS